jgi:hypothetical protein
VDRSVFMRRALWATAVFNAGACLAFLFPASLGQVIGLPLPAPPVYVWFDALVIGTFAGIYAWLASSKEIDRPLVVVATIGKAGFFIVVFACWLRGEVPARAVAFACVDLVFAAIFCWWLVQPGPGNDASAKTPSQ